jgi:hypothetical protein
MPKTLGHFFSFFLHFFCSQPEEPMTAVLPHPTIGGYSIIYNGDYSIIYNKVMGMPRFNPRCTGLPMTLAMATTAAGTCPDASQGHAVTKKHQIKE